MQRVHFNNIQQSASFFSLCFCFVVIIIFNSSLNGQVKLTNTFAEKLEDYNIEFIYPVEAKYKVVKGSRSALFESDFAIKSKRNKLEIRYSFQESIDNKLANIAPHAASFRTVMHLATNEENALITQLTIDNSELLEEFNADWGKIYVFQPKASFSDKEYCKLLSLYKENVGMFYVFFLFNRVSRELDNRFYALRFN